MQIVIIFKSVTYAQRAERLLVKKGITGNIIKAPFGIKSGSCAYGLRIDERNLSLALSVLKQTGLPYREILAKRPDGTYREVVV